MNNFLKSILIGSILSLFLCLIIFGITSHDSSNKTQIENSQNLETVFFLHISKNTVIQRDTIIEFPDLGGYGDDRVKLKGEHFFKATHSNLGYESKFDFEYLRDFIDLFSPTNCVLEEYELSGSLQIILNSFIINFSTSPFESIATR